MLQGDAPVSVTERFVEFPLQILVEPDIDAVGLVFTVTTTLFDFVQPVAVTFSVNV